MDPAAELERNPVVSKHQIRLSMERSKLTREGTAELRETKFSGTNADGEIFIFPVQLTTTRIGKLAG